MNQGEYLFRTNNYIESFHKNLNDSLNSFHPKISYLVEKLKNFTINGYQIYIESIVNNKEEKYIKYSVIDDILLFISKFKKKYKIDLEPNIIIQEESDISKDIESICQKILDFFYDGRRKKRFK